MANMNVSIKLKEDLINDFIDAYSSFKVENNGEYVVFCAKTLTTTVTLFKSKKGYKAYFVGEDALKEAKKWDETAEPIKPKQALKAEWLCLEDQIGSDEVGVGDFLLPMIVVAAYVSHKDIEKLKKYNINDSKKMKDEQILEVVPKLINKFKISKLTIKNSKYNEMIAKGENLNSLKAKMHNQALKNLKASFENVTNVFVDQFVNEETYYEYLAFDEPLQGITFKTKGESYYPSVALASVVARYCLLKEKMLLEEKYKVSFPFGAGLKANEFSKKFIDKFGKEEFDKIAKKNFANYREVF